MASLEMFRKAGMAALRKKSKRLTGYLEFLLKCLPGYGVDFTIITPADPERRGCQLSVLMKRDGRKVFQYISKNGVMADWREPDVIRISPVPMYNSFEDIYRFQKIFQAAWSS